VKKIAAELLRPLNQGLESIGSATNFTTYVDETYIPVVMPLMARSTQDHYSGVCGFRGKAVTIPKSSRAAFRNDAGHDSGMKPVTGSDFKLVTSGHWPEP
jgi:hypothetical protein